jgi:hypothetical protein
MKKYTAKIQSFNSNPSTTPKGAKPQYMLITHEDFHLEDGNVRLVFDKNRLDEVKNRLIKKAAMMGADVDFILADEA